MESSVLPSAPLEQVNTQALLSVAFVIPHKGREHMLVETIESIAGLDTQGFTLEIHIVTKNTILSNDVYLAAKTFPLHVHYAPDEVTISAQRNLGVAATTAEFIAFLDADIALAPNWLQAMYRELQVDGRILVSAEQRAVPDSPKLELIRTALSNAETNTEVQFLPGRNLFVTQKNVALVQGFPEHLETCEDYFFSQALAQHGTLFYTSKSTYIHLGEDKALGPMFKKEIWRGQSNIASIAGRTIPLREWPSFVMPFFITLGLGLSGILALLSLPIFAIALLSIASTPFILYCIRLYRLAPNDVRFSDIMCFYGAYFPARMIGTVKGLFSSLRTESHS
mgnify:FL=1